MSRITRLSDSLIVIDVVLPVLDEREAIPWVLERLPAGYRAIVVDNGSTDGSADVARSLGATVVSQPIKGFGSACFAGLSAATSEIVCFMDCDASMDPGLLPTVADPVAAGTVDMMLGARKADRGAWPTHARIANQYLGWRLRRSYGLPVTDLGPMRAARRADLLALGITDRRSGWPLEMVLRAAQANWRIAEVPIRYLPRVGKSKTTGTVLGTLRAIKDMSKALRAAAQSARS
jgi:glycosyltransferase involved in cell wall biosynthesis